MRTSLLIMAVVLSVVSGCKTGPGTARGPSPCEQLRACTCDVDGGSLPSLCNAIGSFEATDAGQDACAFWLGSLKSVCGEPLELDLNDAAADQLDPGRE